MTTIRYYQNNRNENKFLEVRNDGHYHNAIRQFIYHRYPRRIGRGLVVNFTGDGVLHRWKRANLDELLKDYTETTKPF